jgi:negative regulator of sigma E activity
VEAHCNLNHEYHLALATQRLSPLESERNQLRDQWDRRVEQIVMMGGSRRVLDDIMRDARLRR